MSAKGCQPPLLPPTHAVVVRNRKIGETIQRVSTAERIAGADFQRWLRYKNAQGSDVYLSLNTFKDYAQGRTKADLKQIRHLYLDLDQDGSKKLAPIGAEVHNQLRGRRGDHQPGTPDNHRGKRLDE